MTDRTSAGPDWPPRHPRRGRRRGGGAGRGRDAAPAGRRRRDGGRVQRLVRPLHRPGGGEDRHHLRRRRPGDRRRRRTDPRRRWPRSATTRGARHHPADPLPAGAVFERPRRAIDPAKDVDGANPLASAGSPRACPPSRRPPPRPCSRSSTTTTSRWPARRRGGRPFQRRREAGRASAAPARRHRDRLPPAHQGTRRGDAARRRPRRRRRASGLISAEHVAEVPSSSTWAPTRPPTVDSSATSTPAVEGARRPDPRTRRGGPGHHRPPARAHGPRRGGRAVAMMTLRLRLLRGQQGPEGPARAARAPTWRRW